MLFRGKVGGVKTPPLVDQVVVGDCPDPEMILAGVVVAGDDYRAAKDAVDDAMLVLSACVLEARRAGVSAKLLARAVGVTERMIGNYTRRALEAEGLGAPTPVLHPGLRAGDDRLTD